MALPKFRFAANDNTSIDCTDCSQAIWWRVSDVGVGDQLGYKNMEPFGSEFPVVPLVLNFTNTERGTSFVIAQVPEPNAFWCTGVVAR